MPARLIGKVAVAPRQERSMANHPSSGTPRDSTEWLESDQRELAKKLNHLRNVTSCFSCVKNVWPLEYVTPLDMSPDNAKDAVSSMLSNIMIVSALVLSSMLGPALEPLHSEEAPNLAIVYNFTTACVALMSGWVTIYAAFVLGLIGCESGDTVHRAILHLDSAGMYGHLTYVSLLGCSVAIVVRMWIHYPNTWEPIAITAVASVLFLVLGLHFYRMQVYAFPLFAQYWTRLGVPCMLTAASARRATELGEQLAASIERKFTALPDQGPDHDSAVGDGKLFKAVPTSPGRGEVIVTNCDSEPSVEAWKPGATEPSARTSPTSEEELLQQALPTATPTRRAAILAEMRGEGLTTAMLAEAAAVGGVELLRTLDWEKLGVKHVERLQIITLLLKQQRGRQGS